MSQGATDGGATMCRMHCMSQGAKDGGATMYKVRCAAAAMCVEVVCVS